MIRAQILLAMLLLTIVTTAAGQQNILLVIADDVGIDQIGITNPGNHSTAATPTIDTIANAGVLFEQAWSNPACSPSRASIFTGTHAYINGVGSPRSPELDLSNSTIPDALSGYHSGIFGKWHLGDVPSDYPLLHGWSTHEGTLDGEPLATGQDDIQGFFYYDKHEDGILTGSFDGHDYITFEAARDLYNWVLGVPPGKSWFATLSFNAAHSVTQSQQQVWESPPTQCVETPSPASGNLARYQDMISCMDWTLDRLLAGLSRHGELQDTLVIFVSDNGSDKVPGEGCCTNYFPEGKDKGTVHQGGVHVPLIMAYGSDIIQYAQSGEATGRRVSDPVHLIDLYPTILESAGETPPAPVLEYDAASLLGYLDGTTTQPVHPRLYTESFNKHTDGSMKNCQQAIRDDTYKLIRTITVDGSVIDELFALSLPTLCGENDCEQEGNDLLIAGDPAHIEIAASLAAQLPHQCDAF